MSFKAIIAGKEVMCILTGAVVGLGTPPVVHKVHHALVAHKPVAEQKHHQPEKKREEKPVATTPCVQQQQEIPPEIGLPELDHTPKVDIPFEPIKPDKPTTVSPYVPTTYNPIYPVGPVIGPFPPPPPIVSRVPESPTWVTMTLAFGAIGLSIRGSKTLLIKETT